MRQQKKRTETTGDLLVLSRKQIGVGTIAQFWQVLIGVLGTRACLMECCAKCVVAPRKQTARAWACPKSAIAPKRQDTIVSETGGPLCLFIALVPRYSYTRFSQLVSQSLFHSVSQPFSQPDSQSSSQSA
eukprot:11161023-Lingulodinium_polyedra.AAC.1